MNNCTAVQFRIARHTNKLKEVIHFYGEALGLKQIGSFQEHAGYDGVMFALQGTTCHLEFTSNANGGTCAPPGRDNLLVLYFDTNENFRAATERVEGFGHQPVEPENVYWASRGLTYEDPEGWRVVLYNGTYDAKD